MLNLMPGAARKVSIPVIVVSLLGWILFLIGFAAVNNTVNYKTGLNYTGWSATVSCRNIYSLSVPPHRAGLYWFPHWVVVMVGPFLYICTVLHLIIARWFTGIVTKFLTALYLVCGGAVIYTWGVELFNSTALISVTMLCPPLGWYTLPEWGLWPLIEWVGCLISVVFLTGFMMMWPCFSSGVKPAKQVGCSEEYQEEEQEEQEQEEQEQEEQEQEGEDKQEDKAEEPQETSVE